MNIKSVLGLMLGIGVVGLYSTSAFAQCAWDSDSEESSDCSTDLTDNDQEESSDSDELNDVADSDGQNDTSNWDDSKDAQYTGEDWSSQTVLPQTATHGVTLTPEGVAQLGGEKAAFLTQEASTCAHAQESLISLSGFAIDLKQNTMWDGGPKMEDYLGSICEAENPGKKCGLFSNTTDLLIQGKCKTSYMLYDDGSMMITSEVDGLFSTEIKALLFS